MTRPAGAIILFSGGLDSTTVLAMAKNRGYSCHCLSFQYGQRQSIELARARRICALYGVQEHLVLRIDLDRIGGSSLTSDQAVPKDRHPETMNDEIPTTYVPGRNILFLAHALSLAEARGISDIFLGINAVDYSGYPDCRPDFLEAFATMANLGTKAGASGRPFRFHAPLLSLSKKDIILQGLKLGVDYSLTHSCYDPVGEDACGRCDACMLRLQGFAQAGIKDPARYTYSDP